MKHNMMPKPKKQASGLARVPQGYRDGGKVTPKGKSMGEMKPTPKVKGNKTKE